MSFDRGIPSSVPSLPRLRPRMLAPVMDCGSLPFPLASPGTRYYLLARNAVYEIARSWGFAGQEVLVPAYCHGVEIEALLHAGVRPRFYPVRAGMRVKVGDIFDRVTHHTRAVYLIHYVGFPGPVEAVADLCRSKGLLLIEDCALALLSCYGARPLGSFGDAAVFCLYKTLPVPNGGAAIAREDSPLLGNRQSAPLFASTLAFTTTTMFRRVHHDDGHGKANILSRARQTAKTTLEKLGWIETIGEHFRAEYADTGMSSVSHRIIAAQNFKQIVQRRRRNFSRYLERLGDTAKVVFSELPEGVCPLYFPIQTPHKVALRERLLACGIDAVNVWSLNAPGVNLADFPETDHLRSTVLELPCHQDFSLEAIDWIADHIIRNRCYL